MSPLGNYLLSNCIGGSNMEDLIIDHFSFKIVFGKYTSISCSKFGIYTFPGRYTIINL